MDAQAQSFFKKTNDMTEDHKNPKSARYKESAIIKKFLGSRQGIPFLIGQQKTRSYEHADAPGTDLHAKIDSIIDFYVAWTSNFPVRKNLKVSKYEFLKCVENFCSKSEISQMFGSQLGP